MKRHPWLLPLLLGVGAAALVLARDRENPDPLRVVPSVDLKRYMGTWYEIARLPNRFQRKCVSDTTATYRLREDGKIRVENACLQEGGKLNRATGTARLAGPNEPNSKLKVTFFWPFSGDYWIMDLAPDYRWAVVGAPDRKYLWILSRTPELNEATFTGILERVRQQGYETAPLLRTKHTRPGISQ